MRLGVQKNDKGEEICASEMEHMEVSVNNSFEFILELI